MPDFSNDLENWMGALPNSVRDVPLIYLAIPGTHNSMTYGICSNSKVAPDAENSVRKIYPFFPCIVRRWAITQKFDVTSQLNTGVRFFDLRISLKNTQELGKEYYFVHGLYSFEINKALLEIKDFLDTHPREFVILDCQHFYEFSEKDHHHLQENFKTIFVDKFYGRRDGALSQCTPNKAEVMSKQLIVIYRYDRMISMRFWPGQFWPTPWPNTASIEKLKEYLKISLSNRESGIGFVSQCILTPTPRYIGLRWFLSLKSVAKKVDKRVSDWILEQRPGPFLNGQTPTVNVFLADFVNIRDSDFCKMIINLNIHLLLK